MYLASKPFEATIEQIKALVLQKFDREIAEKQLCYHTREHLNGVQQRANTIFQVVYPYLKLSDNGKRMGALLDLGALAHDLIQIFEPQAEPHSTRRRAAGVSESATVAWLLQLINIRQEDQQQDGRQGLNYSELITEDELQLIREAIAATVCAYDPIEQAIFQPALYDQEHLIAPIARILALADIGALGMDGIAAYHLEGSLLFLEENPDVRSLGESFQLERLAVDDPDLAENIRQRLLKRTRFQVSFAKSRLKRCVRELEGFPPETIAVLSNEVFRYLTPETIQTIESITPTADDTPLDDLLNFFHFEQILPRPT